MYFHVWDNLQKYFLWQQMLFEQKNVQKLFIGSMKNPKVI